MQNQRCALIAVVWLLWLPTSCAAEEGDAPSTRAYLACKMTHGLFACDVYARKQGAVVYAKPDVTSKVLEKVEYGRLISITEPAAKTEKNEWIETDTVLENLDPRAKRKTKTYSGYLRRADVILDTDFRRVTGCWPIKATGRPEESVEDFVPQYIWFTQAGVATAWNPRAPANDKDAQFVRESFKECGEQHVYYADGIFTVRHPQYANLHLYRHGTFDSNRKTVTYASGEVFTNGEGVQWFSPDDLKDCKTIPTVDPDSRAPNPGASGSDNSFH